MPLALVEEMERNRPFCFFDHRNRPVMHDLHPRCKFPHVRNSRAERENPDLRRREKKGLLPDRPALVVIQVMDLVENDPTRTPDALTVLEKGVPVNLGRHDEQPGARVDRDVAGQDADIGRAEPLLEIAELLITQGFDRGRVDNALPLSEGLFDGLFRDEGLAGTGRGRNEERVVFFNPLNGLLLERIKLEFHGH
ncbi:MAG: hypothetical protein BWY49_00790 [Candidatus Omnitrophica bacterium ADurb.Bin314]|nr:MAG: hypothetical protein BWY49_00790 [Candidatus Omnitrophica bacterium ADurb.Bin314]